MRTTSRVVILVLVLTVAFATAAIAEPEGKEKTADKAEASAPNPFTQATKGKKPSKKVYGNDDLQQLASGQELPPLEEGDGAPSPAPAQRRASPAQPSDDAAQAVLEELLESKGKAEQHRQEITAAEGKVTRTMQEIAAIERRLIAIRNPLLARPQAPEGTEEEWDGMTAPQRVERSKEDLAKAQAELKEAEDDLARLRSSGR